MTAAIEIDELTKTFTVRERGKGLVGAMRAAFVAPTRTLTAVDALSLRVEPGERIAFIGPNGAGKSTALKMLSGILHPTSGRASVMGLCPWDERRRLAHRIGTVFGQRSQLWYHLPAAETFELLARIYDLPLPQYRQRRDGLVERFEIGAQLSKPVRQLSLGQRMRCEVVASLLHAPDVLFLDEPTIGLDVSAKATIRDVIRHDSEHHGRTVVLTSHDTGDMERVCDRVVVIHAGRVLVDERIEHLRTRLLGRKRVVVRTAEATLSLDLPGVRVLSQRPHHTTLEVETDRSPIETVVQAVLRSSGLLDLTIEDPPMDEVIQTLYERARRQASP
ncbi:MAG: ATP-binding cassette domain-containing protein [Myxococcota bacterium]